MYLFIEPTRANHFEFLIIFFFGGHGDKMVIYIIYTIISYLIAQIIYLFVIKILLPFISWTVDKTFCHHCHGIGLIDFAPEQVVENCEHCDGTGRTKWFMGIKKKVYKIDKIIVGHNQLLKIKTFGDDSRQHP